jgi:hypothetical protein
MKNKNSIYIFKYAKYGNTRPLFERERERERKTTIEKIILQKTKFICPPITHKHCIKLDENLN